MFIEGWRHSHAGEHLIGQNQCSHLHLNLLFRNRKTIQILTILVNSSTLTELKTIKTTDYLHFLKLMNFKFGLYAELLDLHNKSSQTLTKIII